MESECLTCKSIIRKAAIAGNINGIAFITKKSQEEK